jgi:hypothetical protein
MILWVPSRSEFLDHLSNCRLFNEVYGVWDHLIVPQSVGVPGLSTCVILYEEFVFCSCH